jgi:hypothetical protein
MAQAESLTSQARCYAVLCAAFHACVTSALNLTDDQFRQLVSFVRNGLLDQRAKPGNLRKLILRSVPSGFPVLTFE